MKRTHLLALLFTGFINFHFAYSQKIVVSYPEYSRTTSSIDVGRYGFIQHLKLREGLIYGLKKAGFEIAKETSLPKRTHKLSYRSYLNYFQDIPNTDMLIYLEVKESVILKVFDKERTILFEQTIDIQNYSINELGPFIDKIRSDNSETLFEIEEGSLTLEGFDELSDYSFYDRLETIHGLLPALDKKKVDPNTIMQLAVLYAYHASFFTRSNFIKSSEYFGKALFYAELLTTIDQGNLIKNDIVFLAKRLGAGYDVIAKHQPVTPLVDHLDNLNQLTINDGEYPPITSLVDFLARIETYKTYPIQDYQTVYNSLIDLLRQKMRISEKLESYFLDLLLTFSKDNYESDFNSAMILYNQTMEYRTYQSEYELILDLLDKEKEFEDIKPFIGESKEELLEKMIAEDSRFNEITAPQDWFSLQVASLCTQLKRRARASSTIFSNNHALTIHDVIDELIDRYLQIIIVRQRRLSNVGRKDLKIEIDDLLKVFGNNQIIYGEELETSNRIKLEEIYWEKFIPLLQNVDESKKTPALKVLSCLSDNSKLLLVDEEQRITHELKESVLIDLNQMLESADFYDGRYFSQHQMSSSYSKTYFLSLVSSSDISSRVRTNRELFEKSFPQIVASISYSFPLKNSFRLENDKIRNNAHNLYLKGNYAEAIKAAYISKQENRHYLFWSHYADGNFEDAFNIAYEYWDEDFERDDLAMYLLRNLDTVFNMKQHRILDPDYTTTKSARDYISRMEYHIRMKNYDEVRRVSDEYHYTSREHADFMNGLASILKYESNKQYGIQVADSVEESYWNQIRGSIDGYIWRYSFGESFDILDGRMKENEHWKLLVEQSNLYETSLHMKALVAISKQLDKDEYLYLLDETIKALNSDRNSNFSPHLAKSLAMNTHMLLARIFLSETSYFSKEIGTELNQYFNQVMSISKRYEFDLPVPNEALFLGHMVRYGGKSEEIASFLESKNFIKDELRSENRLFNLMLDKTELLTYYLEIIRYSNLNLKLWEFTWPTSIPKEHIFHMSVSLNMSNCALTCAMDILLNSDDFKYLAVFFEEESEATDWISANAPTIEKKNLWLNSYYEGKQSKYIKNDVPSLFDFMDK